MDADKKSYIDVLIETEQKQVIAEYVVQQYLQEIWNGQLEWATWKTLALFFLIVVVPPVWVFFSLPLQLRMHRIPLVKFMGYLTSHIYFIGLLTLTCAIPPDTTYRYND